MNEGGRNRSASERLNAKMLDQMFVNMVGQGKKMKKSGVSMGLLLFARQGSPVSLTQEDITAKLLNCSVRTVRRDIKALAKRGVIAPTREQQKDSGPGASHKVEAVRFFMERRTYTMEELRLINKNLSEIFSINIIPLPNLFK